MAGFEQLLDALAPNRGLIAKGTLELQGYLPADAVPSWRVLGLAADPGVLEVNIPPCGTWSEYARWMRLLAECARPAGLRPWRQRKGRAPEGTGGGNHVVFGAAPGEPNVLFSNPAWVASIIRFWQRHPSLAYLFTGSYVGPTSQAPRADESGIPLHDLELALRHLESLPRGDQRLEIGRTLKHLMTDASGNPHRAEISFDKFWNPGAPSGTLGLIEFRAIESLPKPEWSAAVALLWQACAAMLLRHPDRKPLVNFGGTLHDRYFLPIFLWLDLLEILDALSRNGIELPVTPFAEIHNWRFPLLLRHAEAGGFLEIRSALEPWPLLAETPPEGGNTSRFVDTSMRRLELRCNSRFAREHRILVSGRPVSPVPLLRDLHVVAVRYRHSKLEPSLHPGIEPHLPLRIDIHRRDGEEPCASHILRRGNWRFTPARGKPPPRGKPCRTTLRGDFTCDLRLF